MINSEKDEKIIDLYTYIDTMKWANQFLTLASYIYDNFDESHDEVKLDNDSKIKVIAFLRRQACMWLKEYEGYAID